MGMVEFVSSVSWCALVILRRLDSTSAATTMPKALNTWLSAIVGEA